jgi:dihydroxyacetone kinase
VTLKTSASNPDWIWILPPAAFFRAATRTLVDQVDELTALDQAIGDGDHGLNMKRGAEAIQAKRSEIEAKPLNEALKIIGAVCDNLHAVRGQNAACHRPFVCPERLPMKKLINHADDVLAESFDGFATAHGDIVSLRQERQCGWQ